jgi:hypothetical protein
MTNLEFDFKAPTSCGLMSQLLRYGILTLGGFLHHPFEFQAPSLDLLDPDLQVPNLTPGDR